MSRNPIEQGYDKVKRTIAETAIIKINYKYHMS
jgi:hypothetical protein